MDTITERGALHGAALSPIANRLAVTLAPQCGRLALRVGEGDRQAVGEALGFALPAEIGDLHVAGETLAFCLGPDEWQVLLPEAELAAIEARLEPLRDRCSVVDVSHREVGIELRGSAATLALASFCSLDLDAMPSGSATRTILDKAAAILVKHGPDHYRIEVWNSFASHVWGLIACAHTEIRLDI